MIACVYLFVYRHAPAFISLLEFLACWLGVSGRAGREGRELAKEEGDEEDGGMKLPGDGKGRWIEVGEDEVEEGEEDRESG